MNNSWIWITRIADPGMAFMVKFLLGKPGSGFPVILSAWSQRELAEMEIRCRQKIGE